MFKSILFYLPILVFKYYLKIILYSVKVAYMTPIEFSYSPATLPASFQADNHWPRLITEVQDQVNLS